MDGILASLSRLTIRNYCEPWLLVGELTNDILYHDSLMISFVSNALNFLQHSGIFINFINHLPCFFRSSSELFGIARGSRTRLSPNNKKTDWFLFQKAPRFLEFVLLRLA